MRYSFKGIRIGKLIITTQKRMENANVEFNAEEVIFLFKKLKKKLLHKNDR